MKIGQRTNGARCDTANDYNNPMPPAWIAIWISVLSLLVSVSGWVIVHKLTIRRERDRAKETGASDWIKELTEEAAMMLSLIQQDHLKSLPFLEHVRLEFTGWGANPPNGIPFVKRTAILSAIDEFCSISTKEAAEDGGQSAIEALEKLLAALRAAK